MVNPGRISGSDLLPILTKRVKTPKVKTADTTNLSVQRIKLSITQAASINLLSSTNTNIQRIKYKTEERDLVKNNKQQQ